MTDRPWPENAWPTAEQWLPWFLEQTPDEQLMAAERIVRSAQEAHECFTRGHEGWERRAMDAEATVARITALLSETFHVETDGGRYTEEVVSADDLRDALSADRVATDGGQGET